MVIFFQRWTSVVFEKRRVKIDFKKVLDTGKQFFRPVFKDIAQKIVFDKLSGSDNSEINKKMEQAFDLAEEIIKSSETKLDDFLLLPLVSGARRVYEILPCTARALVSVLEETFLEAFFSNNISPDLKNRTAILLKDYLQERSIPWEGGITSSLLDSFGLDNAK